MKLGKIERSHVIIIVYFLVLSILALQLASMFAVSWEQGIIRAVLELLPAEMRRDAAYYWWAAITFLFGAFYGALGVVAYFDLKRRLQSSLILLASSALAIIYASTDILPRFWIFFLGITCGGYLSYVKRERIFKNYWNCRFGAKIAYRIAASALAVSLFDLFLGEYDRYGSIGPIFFRDQALLPMYLFFAGLFIIVFKKFISEGIVKSSIMVVGPQGAGKTVFMCALYNQAVDRVQTFPSKDLLDVHGQLTDKNGCWPPPTLPHENREYRFEYIMGELFVKEIEVRAYDYSGELFDTVVSLVEKKKEEVKKAAEEREAEEIPLKVAYNILEADRLIFILDMKDLYGEAATRQSLVSYISIAKSTGKPYYLVATKSDVLWDEKWDMSDENYRRLTERVRGILNQYSEFEILEGKAEEEVIPVFVYTERAGRRKGCPMLSDGRLVSMGYDRILEVLKSG